MLNVRVLTDTGNEWQIQNANLLNRGGFAFFVFEVNADWYIGDWLAGLTWAEPEESHYYVAGTLDQFASACCAYCHDSSPDDIIQFYNYVYTKLSEFGFQPKGQRVKMINGFYLR